MLMSLVWCVLFCMTVAGMMIFYHMASQKKKALNGWRLSTSIVAPKKVADLEIELKILRNLYIAGFVTLVALIVAYPVFLR